MRALLTSLLATAFLVVATPGDATACSPMPIESFAGESDAVRPGGVSVGVKVSRGDFFCPGEPQHSCGDLASVQLILTPVEGTTLAPAVRLRLDAAAPMGLPLDGPLALRPNDDGTAVVPLMWGDGPTFEQEPLDFRVTVTPFDGDDGPSTIVHVTDPGRSGAEPCRPPIVDAVDAGSLPPLSGNPEEEEEPLPPGGCACDAGGLTFVALGALLLRRRAVRPLPAP